LGGPIVKCAERERVFIWLATKTKVKVKLEIFNRKEYRGYNNGSMDKSRSHAGLGNEESKQVGKNFSFNLAIANDRFIF
jgi:hypothetical protein